jgi:hypothetical protein
MLYNLMCFFNNENLLFKLGQNCRFLENIIANFKIFVFKFGQFKYSF